jgi:hypothetical protein
MPLRQRIRCNGVADELREAAGGEFRRETATFYRGNVGRRRQFAARNARKALIHAVKLFRNERRHAIIPDCIFVRRIV